MFSPLKIFLESLIFPLTCALWYIFHTSSVKTADLRGKKIGEVDILKSPRIPGYHQK